MEPDNGITEQEPLVYTVAQLRRRLGPGTIGRSTLYEAIRRGELWVVHVGARILIPSKAVTDWLEGTGVTGQARR